MGIDFEELRSFVAVAEAGSILRAANSLQTSRARVRRQLDQLEVALGVTMLVRQRDGVSLTKEGATFLPRARQLLGEVRSLVLHMRDFGPRLSEPLRIGLQVGYPAHLALTIQKMVRRRFCELRFEIFVSERPIELLPDKVDVVLCLGLEHSGAGCVALPVSGIQQSLFASEAFLARVGTITTLEQVREHLVGVWRGPSDSAPQLHLLAGGSEGVETPLSTSDEQYLECLALADEGLVYAPLLLPNTALGDRAKLRPVLAKVFGRRVTAQLLVSRSLADVPRFRVLFEAVCELVERVALMVPADIEI